MTENQTTTDDRLEHLPEHEIDGEDMTGGGAPATARDAGPEADTDEGDPDDVNPAPTFHA